MVCTIQVIPTTTLHLIFAIHHLLNHPHNMFCFAHTAAAARSFHRRVCPPLSLSPPSQFRRRPKRSEAPYPNGGIFRATTTQRMWATSFARPCILVTLRRRREGCLSIYLLSQGGDCARPFILALAFGPSILGIGFLVALAVLIRGTPWKTRGSFMRVGSSFAGVRVTIDL